MEATKSEPRFEESMKRLEEIVSALENPELPLEDAMNLYKEGTQCSRFCREKLEAARHELEIWQNGTAESVSISEIDEI